MEFGLKWVHMARYELILRLEGALWLLIIFRPLLTPKGAIKTTKNANRIKVVGVYKNLPGVQQIARDS